MAETRTHTTEQNKRKTIVLTALLAALTCVATMVLVIPSPSGGYMNLGDAVVLLGACLLGPVYGAAAGGIGAALADLLAGYPMYVPATLVIKAGMGLLAGSLYRMLRQRKWAVLVCGGAAELLMVLGYWLYDGFLLGSLAGSAVGIPANLTQAVFGLAAASLLVPALKKSGYVRGLFPYL